MDLQLLRLWNVERGASIMVNSRYVLTELEGKSAREATCLEIEFRTTIIPEESLEYLRWIYIGCNKKETIREKTMPVPI